MYPVNKAQIMWQITFFNPTVCTKLDMLTAVRMCSHEARLLLKCAPAACGYFNTGSYIPVLPSWIMCDLASINHFLCRTWIYLSLPKMSFHKIKLSLLQAASLTEASQLPMWGDNSHLTSSRFVDIFNCSCTVGYSISHLLENVEPDWPTSRPC